MEGKQISPRVNDWIGRALLSRNAKTTEGRRGDRVKFQDTLMTTLMSILSKTKWTKKETITVCHYPPPPD